MLDFIVAAVLGLKQLLNIGSWQQAVQSVIDFFGKLTQTHYKYWHTVSGHVAAAWQQLTRTLLWLMQNMQLFMFAQYEFDYRVAKQWIPWLANWIKWLGGRVRNEINATIAMLRREYKAGDAAQHAYTRSVLAWILIHVLAFLYKLVLRLFGWIHGIGATMWHYFTHLADFAELLIMALVAALEHHAWDIGKLLGKFFLALIVRNVTRFATLVETIVDAVL